MILNYTEDDLINYDYLDSCISLVQKDCRTTKKNKKQKNHNEHYILEKTTEALLSLRAHTYLCTMHKYRISNI